MFVKYQDLENKIILVTGASRGIGRTIASGLAEQQAHVVFNYRSNEESALELAKELENLGASKATPIKFDVTDSAAMKENLTSFMSASYKTQEAVCADLSGAFETLRKAKLNNEIKKLNDALTKAEVQKSIQLIVSKYYWYLCIAPFDSIIVFVLAY